MRQLLLLIACLLGFSISQAASSSQAIENLSKAIQFRTVSHQNKNDIDYQEFDKFLKFLESRYPNSFQQLQLERINQYNLLFKWQGSNAALKPVMFDGHYDVVPVEPGTESDWDQPPYSGAVLDGFVWGRGAVDDKGAVITMLEATEALLAEAYAPERTLLFSIVHDEEIGGAEGAVKIAEHLLANNIRLEYLIGEGGFLVDDAPMLPDGGVMAMVSTAEKLYVTLLLTAKAEGGHSSKPPKNSAIVELAKAVTALHENPFEPELVPPATDMFEALAPYRGSIQGFMMSKPGLFGGLLARGMSDNQDLQGMVRTTTAVTMLNSGVKENVVPQSATAAVNFRLLPNITPDELIEIVKEKINNPVIEISISNDVPLGGTPPIADKNGIGFKVISESVLAVEPNAVVVPGLFLATTDARHYKQLTDNIYRFHAALTLSSDDSSVVHGTNERVSVAAFERAVEITEQIVRRAGSR